MRGKTDVMFGHKGSVSDPPVNLKTMAGYVGTDPEKDDGRICGNRS